MGADLACPKSAAAPSVVTHLDVETRVATRADAAGLASLFARAESPCFCRYWHFVGDTNAWLEKCAVAPDTNREEFEHALSCASDEARGIVAVTATQIVGWLKVAPATSMRKAYERRFYKSLPCFEGDRDGVFLIGCMLVDPAMRHHGVAMTLVQRAMRLSKDFGARILEAMPRRPSEPVSDEELWTGPANIFVACGFEQVSDFGPYPVFRRRL